MGEQGVVVDVEVLGVAKRSLLLFCLTEENNSESRSRDCLNSGKSALVSVIRQSPLRRDSGPG